jgi:hypothetical protein
MKIFQPKKGPILRLGRFAHLLWGMLAPVLGALNWGYGGSIVGGIGIIVIGFLWEISNRFTGGWHPFGDALDFWSFVIGATLSGVGCALLVGYDIIPP